MLSRQEVAIIRAEIERLKEARAECADSGIRKQIDAWIEQQKRKLVADGTIVEAKGMARSENPILRRRYR